MSLRRNILSTEKPPLLLAIFLAALSWEVTRYADSLQNSPAVAYQRILDVQDRGGSATIILSNLTRDTAFDDLTIQLETTAFDDAWSEAVAPARRGTVETASGAQTVTFKLATFQPGSTVKLGAHYTGAPPTLRLLSSSEPILLHRAPSLAVFIVHHQHTIIFLFLLLWAIVTLLLLVFAPPAKSSSQCDTPNT